MDQELETKLIRLQALLAQHQAQAILLRRVSSFAWLTAGASSYVNTAATEGASALLVTARGRFLISNNIEAPRLVNEEKLLEQGWQLVTYPWHDTSDVVPGLVNGQKLLADVPYSGAQDVSGQLARLRARLTVAEGERFRQLGQLCAQIIHQAVESLRPGMSEYEICGLMAGAAEARGVQAVVNLVATDERTQYYRHPLPTGKKLERYAMLVFCGRKWGLVCSLSRLVHFGAVPQLLQEKLQAVARVDTALIHATRPGQTLGQILSDGQAAYAAAGFPDEWRNHHQGGAVGYQPREYLALPDSKDQVVLGQAFAWNPSIAGVKSEDTILAGEQGVEVLTDTPAWPGVTVVQGDQEMLRPGILELP